MNRRADYIKAAIQILSALLGLWGLVTLCFGIYFIVLRLTEPAANGSHRSFTALIFLLFGAYFVFVSFINIWRFSIRSVTHFSGVVAFFALGVMGQLAAAVTEPQLNENNHFIFLLTTFVPLLAAVSLYLYGKKILIKLTGLA